MLPCVLSSTAFDGLILFQIDRLVGHAVAQAPFWPGTTALALLMTNCLTNSRLFLALLATCRCEAKSPRLAHGRVHVSAVVCKLNDLGRILRQDWSR